MRAPQHGTPQHGTRKYRTAGRGTPQRGTPRYTRRVLGTAAASAALLLSTFALPGGAQAGEPGGAGGKGKQERVLVFSKTEGFRHDSIPDGIAAVEELGEEAGFTVDTTEDADDFQRGKLARYDAVVFLSTTGDVLGEQEQAAFEDYIRRGGGYVGIHAAADTEYEWPFYGELAGAWFASHPHIQPAVVEVEDRAHPATSHLGRSWERTDEWYNYRSSPRDDARILASLDEDSYTGGTMDGDHPIAWCQGSVDGTAGRAFYTGGGHTKESYADEAFRAHLLGGIRYATGAAHADCRPEQGYKPLFDGSGTEGWKQAGPGGFTLDDGTLTSAGGMGLFWYEAEELSSYSLKLDWRMTGDDNSGVFVGFPASDDPWSAVEKGYEIQIDATDADDRTTGAVYGFQSADLDARDAALNPPGDGASPARSAWGWNAYEIRVEGERLRVYLNGTLVNDFTNTDPERSLTDGYIGLQNHGDEDEVSFRDIRLKTPAGAGPGSGSGSGSGSESGSGSASGVHED